MQRIGFIGLGNMGMPMARNLLRGGLQVHVFNRTRSRLDEIERLGACVEISPETLTRGTDLVLLCLANESACEEILLGSQGVILNARQGQILIDHSTVSPILSRRCSQAAGTKSVDFLDAPVSGGPEGAERASLTIMVGGKASAFRTALPVLRLMGWQVSHMGESGSGTLTKLVNQALVGVHTQAACEAVVLASTFGLNPEKLLPVLKESWGNSVMLERNLPRIKEKRFGPSPAPLRNLSKDFSIILGLAREQRLMLPMVEQCGVSLRKAAKQGLSAQDLSSLYPLLAALSKNWS